MKPETILFSLVLVSAIFYIAVMVAYQTVDWTIILFILSFSAICFAYIRKFKKLQKKKE